MLGSVRSLQGEIEDAGVFATLFACESRLALLEELTNPFLVIGTIISAPAHCLDLLESLGTARPTARATAVATTSGT